MRPRRGTQEQQTAERHREQQKDEKEQDGHEREVDKAIIAPIEPRVPSDPVVAAQAALLEEYLRVEPDAVTHILRPLAALREVIAVCESVRGGRQPPQPNDRRSLANDVQLSLASLGDQAKRALQPTLHDYCHGELAEFCELFDDRGGVVRLLNATKILVDRLRRPVCSQALWRDLLASCGPVSNLNSAGCGSCNSENSRRASVTSGSGAVRAFVSSCAREASPTVRRCWRCRRTGRLGSPGSSSPTPIFLMATYASAKSSSFRTAFGPRR